MPESTLAQISQSSEKGRADEKTFRIPISNGIFAHYGRLKDARWLLDLFVDWTTKEVQGTNGRRDGIVLGGKPIRDEDTACAFRRQCSARTTRRWRQRLARYGYITQKRTPLGYVIRVMKSKKWAHLETPTKKVIGQEWPVRSAKNGRSELRGMAGVNYQVWPVRTTDHGRSNKDSAVQDKDRAVEEATAAAVSLNLKDSEEWKVINLAPMGSRPFREGWVNIYGERKPDEKLSDVMERHILLCNDSGITIPKPFYDAKRSVEELEDGAGGSNDRLPRLDVLDREPGRIGNGELPPLQPFRRIGNGELPPAEPFRRLPPLDVG